MSSGLKSLLKNYKIRDYMNNKTSHKIFVSGSTGYIGTHLIPKLLDKGHEVIALARKDSEYKIDKRAKIVFGRGPIGRSADNGGHWFNSQSDKQSRPFPRNGPGGNNTTCLGGK